MHLCKTFLKNIKKESTKSTLPIFVKVLFVVGSDNAAKASRAIDSVKRIGLWSGNYEIWPYLKPDITFLVSILENLIKESAIQCKIISFNVDSKLFL